MSLFSSFALSFGALLALQAVIAAWLFRTAAAPLWAKVAVPSLIVALGCYAPFAVASMMGFPVEVGMSGLPQEAELVAFVAHDEDKLVDLWLKTGPVPRAYETELTRSLKKTLEQAREAMARGEIALLKKGRHGKGGGKGAGNGDGKGSSKAGDRLGIGDDQTMYELDPSALDALPPKE